MKGPALAVPLRKGGDRGGERDETATAHLGVILLIHKQVLAGSPPSLRLWSVARSLSHG